jgi:hypothetical protein
LVSRCGEENLPDISEASMKNKLIAVSFAATGLDYALNLKEC